MSFALMLLIVGPLCMLAGFIDSAAGGGGLISLPAYLLAGLPPALASGTNKLSACIGSLFANIAYLRKGKTLMLAALMGAAGALPGAALGARLLLMMTADVIRPMLLIAVPAVAFLVMRAKGEEAPPPTGWRATRWARAAIPLCIGFFVGMYDGFFGPGTGTFLALLLRAAMGLNWITATATAKMINLASNAASLVVFLANGSVMIPLGLCAAGFSIAGNLLGARLAIRKGGRAIRAMLIVALSLLLLTVIKDLFFG